MHLKMVFRNNYIVTKLGQEDCKSVKTCTCVSRHIRLDKSLGCCLLIGSVVGLYLYMDQSYSKNCHFKIKCWTEHTLCVHVKIRFYHTNGPVCWISLLSKYFSFLVTLKCNVFQYDFSFKQLALSI